MSEESQEFNNDLRREVKVKWLEIGQEGVKFIGGTYNKKVKEENE